MHKANKTRFWGILAGAAFICVLSGAQALATPFDLEHAVLSAGGNLSIGNNVTIDAAITAKGNLSTGTKANLTSIYSASRIWVDNYSVIRGKVLANNTAEAGKNLDLIGDWTGKSAGFGNNAKITGDVVATAKPISIGNNAKITGNVNGNHNIWIGSNSSVTGDASPGLGKRLSTGRNVTIGGSRDPAPAPVETYEGPFVTDLPEPSHGSAGSTSIWRGNNISYTLAAGAYKTVGFGNNVTLSLGAGEYTMKSFWIGNNAQINVDTSAGDVELNILGDFGTGNKALFNKVGSGRLIVNVFNGGDVWLGNETVVAAQVAVWDGNFETGQSADLTGQFYATNNIWIGNNSNVVLNNDVPEPSSLVLTCLGGLLMIKHRRRLKSIRTNR